MIRLLCILLILVLIQIKAHAQKPVFAKEWEKVLGSATWEYGNFNMLSKDSSGNFYVAGHSSGKYPSGTKTDHNCYSFDSTTTPVDIWVTKVDANGNIMWDRTLGGVLDDGFSYSFSDNKNNVYIIGVSNSKPDCEKTEPRYSKKQDWWIVKLNESNVVQWDKRLGDIWDDKTYCGAMTPDNKLLIGGYSNGYIPGGDVTDTFVGFIDIWIVKMDTNGTKIWDNNYGSSSWDLVYNILPISDSKYLITGSTNGTYYGPSYGDVSDSSFSLVFDSTYWKYDNWLLLIDSAGNKIWDRRYGCLKADDYALCAALSSNGNVAIGATLGMASLQGNFYPCNDGIQDTLPRGWIDSWVYVIDTANGDILKQRRFGGNVNEQVIQILTTNDGGYLCVCHSNSDSSFEKSENRKVNLADPNNYDFWLVRMDSNLNIIWDKTIGSGKRDETPSVILLDDSTFILAGVVTAGNSGDVGAPLYDSIISNAYDFWISKWHIVNPSNIEEINHYSFSLYPNPTTDIFVHHFTKHKK
ncbi:MAG: hypothetical protein IPO27_02840 [Bacteroidetes bacterium]|nr:hypothetical protein [Bacteroidota bacterium]